MSTAYAPRPGLLSGRSLLILAGFLILCFASAALGSAATQPQIGEWYAGLAKPSFTPPNAAFPLAWTILYALMAVAAWRVAVIGAGPARSRALVAFAVQLALNTAWSFLFFAAENPLLGLIDIVALVAAIAWTIRLFRPIDRVAAGLLLPYIAWVCYATALNAAILYLNS